MRPLKEIGQAKKEGGISFLRRTQYTAEAGASRGLPSPFLGVTPRKRRLDSSKEDPRTILRNVIKGFDLANPENTHAGLETPDQIKGAQPTPAEQDAWKNPKHPTNKSLKPLDFYPVLPDLEAMPADGGYMVARFHGDPGAVEDDDYKVPESYRSDLRVDTSLLQVIAPPPETVTNYELRSEQYARDPENHKDPGGYPFDYQFFLPEDMNVTENAIKAFDAGVTPLDEIDELYTTVREDEPSKSCFRFKHARFYETRSNMAHSTPYERVAMVLHDGEETAEDDDLGLGDDDRIRKLPKAAYYAPTVLTNFLRPKRRITDKFGREAEMEDTKIDFLQVRAMELDGELAEKRNEILDKLRTAE